MIGVENDRVGGPRHGDDENARRAQLARKGEAIARRHPHQQRLAADDQRLALLVETSAAATPSSVSAKTKSSAAPASVASVLRRWMVEDSAAASERPSGVVEGS